MTSAITVHCSTRAEPSGSWSLSEFVIYRRIPKVTAPVTFGFSRQTGPLLTGSRYFRMVKKRLYSNRRSRQSGRVTQEIKRSVYLCL